MFSVLGKVVAGVGNGTHALGTIVTGGKLGSTYKEMGPAGMGPCCAGLMLAWSLLLITIGKLVMLINEFVSPYSAVRTYAVLKRARIKAVMLKGLGLHGT